MSSLAEIQRRLDAFKDGTTDDAGVTDGEDAFYDHAPADIAFLLAENERLTVALQNINWLIDNIESGNEKVAKLLAGLTESINKLEP